MLNVSRFVCTFESIMRPPIISLLLACFAILPLFSQNKKDDQGQKQGYWVVYGKDKPKSKIPANGKVEEGTYVDNRKEGLWIKYHKDGKTPRIKGVYKNNRPNGLFERYYENGELMEKGDFYKNKFSGNYWQYHKNGKMSLYSPCGKDPDQCDTVYYYYESGCLSHKDFRIMGGQPTRSIVFSKTRCNTSIDTVFNYETWAASYEWESDTINEIQTVRLVYPLTTEAIEEAFIGTNAKKLDASAVYFWQVVAAGKNAVPHLLEMLDNNRQTGVMDKCKTSYLTVSELAYLALNEIAEFPVVQNEGVLSSCGQFKKKWRQPENANNLSLMLGDFYETNKEKYKFMPLADASDSAFKKKYGVKGKLVLLQ
mgnify:CR=1 FL=1